jgi:hypothetical protein
MPSVLQGAVIVKCSGQNVDFKHKCEKCGSIMPGSISTVVRERSTLESSFKCTKCGNMQKVRIKG